MRYSKNCKTFCYKVINYELIVIDLMSLRKLVQILKAYLSKICPDIDVEFYLSCRSNFVHVGLDFPLCSLKNHLEFVKEIHEFLSKGLDSTCFQLVDPQLVLTVKWKYDYIIVRKIKKRKMSNLMNSYVQDYVSSNLKWYEHDSLLT